MLKEIAAVFLRLGLFGFGGPVAVMAMMEEETSRKRGWISADEFSEIYAVCKMLPGPVSTQMAIYLGQYRAGLAGGLVSGVVFILPSFVMVLALSYLYKNSGAVQSASPILLGLQAAALAVIVMSTWQLGRPYRTDLRAWGIIALSSVIVYLHAGWEPLVILSFGAMGIFLAKLKAGSAKASTPASGKLHGFAFIPAAQAALAAWASSDTTTLSRLFMMCFKAGFLVFGTGLAVVPVLEADSVTRFGWLTHSQFMDGLAMGQVTPGPVVITSTFIGFQAAGFAGAIAATVGMFLPSFINVLFLVPRVWKRFSGTPGARGFSAYAIPAVIGGILGTTLKLGQMTMVGPLAAAVFVSSLVAAIWFRPPAWVLIPVAGLVAGVSHHFLG
jgi:chromate transporter